MVRQAVAPAALVAVRALAAPKDWLRVWVGTLNQDDPQRPKMWLDGLEVPAEKQRLARPFRRVDMENGRVFSGVVDLPCPPSSQTHRVRVEIETSNGVLSCDELTRTLPTEVPTPGARLGNGTRAPWDAAFNVLLVSCYAAEHDVHVADVVRAIKARNSVDLVLTVGDQVYLDQPWRKAELHAAADLFVGGLPRFLEDKYWRNFSGAEELNRRVPNGMTEILRLAPSAAIPDDHEYWNNYPVPSLVAATITYSANVADVWAGAARALYDSYQLAEDDTYDYRIDVHPLSFWMMDNRTFRRPGTGTTLRQPSGSVPGGLDEFTRWMDDVIEKRLVPVVVTGPSIVQKPVRRPTGWFGDFNFANFSDYPDVIEQLLRPSAVGLPVLLLTGDVHYGRVLQIDASTAAGNRAYGDRWIYEVISSPTSLVNPIAAGKLKLSTKPKTWKPVQDRQLPYVSRYPTKTRPGYDEKAALEQAADHVALLRFTRTVVGVDLEITYYPIPDDNDVRFKPQHVDRIRLGT